MTGRDPLAYLSDWGVTQPDKGSQGYNGSDGGDYEGNHPAAIDSGSHPLSTEEGVEYEPCYGQDAEDAGQKASAWGMTQSEIGKGFEKVDGYDDGQYHQDIPASNQFDRGSGSDVRAKEFKATEGRGFDGRGHDKSTPGEQQIGSADYPFGSRS
jgi:hypothetical protein